MTSNLILITNPAINALADFEFVAQQIQSLAPDIHTAIFDDRPIDWRQLSSEWDRPTMTFSPGPLRYIRPLRGKVFQGIRLRKSQEYAALESVGVRVPKWALLTQQRRPDLTHFGPYVVVKPDCGGRGADVKIKRKGRVRWRPAKTDFIQRLAGEACDWIVQDFVYTGSWPVSYRVASLFGEPLWAWKVEASRERRQLRHRYDFGGGGISIVASGKACIFSLCEDADILALAKRPHTAFAQIPLIGVDVLRDADTGQLVVIEVNAVGLTWHFSSPIGRKIQHDFGFDLDAQFDGKRKAARILADQVRIHAS